MSLLVPLPHHTCSTALLLSSSDTSSLSSTSLPPPATPPPPTTTLNHRIHPPLHEYRHAYIPAALPSCCPPPTHPACHQPPQQGGQVDPGAASTHGLQQTGRQQQPQPQGSSSMLFEPPTYSYKCMVVGCGVWGCGGGGSRSTQVWPGHTGCSRHHKNNHNSSSNMCKLSNKYASSNRCLLSPHISVGLVSSMKNWASCVEKSAVRNQVFFRSGSPWLLVCIVLRLARGPVQSDTTIFSIKSLTYLCCAVSACVGWWGWRGLLCCVCSWVCCVVSCDQTC
jgi:hypothetical protein